MTAANVNARTAPTPEALQEALEFLRILSEQRSSPDNGGKQDPNSTGSDILKTIEAALKICSEAKTASAHGEADSEKEDGNVRRKRHAARTAEADLDEEDEDSDADAEDEDAEDEDAEDEDADEEDDEDEEDDDEEDDDNPFAGDYYWCPGPEWKAIGLVAGGAALVGLGALLYKMFDD